jgi:hypothetical protein
MIGLLELLAARGFMTDPRRAKLVRHKDLRFDIEGLVRDGLLEKYQEFQGDKIFDGCDQIVAFVGEDGTKSRFVGVFDVGPRRPAKEAADLANPETPVWMKGAKYWYRTTRRSEFRELENRLIIDWGSATRAWHQWFRDRPVLEIRQLGRLLPPFWDYLHVNLTHRELKALALHPEAHRDWVAGLSAVGGVYLVVSTITGQQYVGSATGERGIWQRWREYAESGHCGNSKLAELCTSDSRHPDAFTFSILEPFSLTTTRDVALKQEAFFKRKLGSRAFGLNDN